MSRTVGCGVALVAAALVALMTSGLGVGAGVLLMTSETVVGALGGYICEPDEELRHRVASYQTTGRHGRYATGYDPRVSCTGPRGTSDQTGRALALVVGGTGVSVAVLAAVPTFLFVFFGMTRR